MRRNWSEVPVCAWGPPGAAEGSRNFRRFPYNLRYLFRAPFNREGILMSAIAESLRRQRLPLLTIAAVLVLGTVAWVMISNTTSEHLTSPDYPVAAPAVEQADWKFNHTLEGRFGKLTKSQQEQLAVQRPKVVALVQSIYDGIFIEPSELERVIKDSFSAAAARSIHTDKLGFPRGATEVKTHPCFRGRRNRARCRHV